MANATTRVLPENLAATASAADEENPAFQPNQIQHIFVIPPDQVTSFLTHPTAENVMQRTKQKRRILRKFLTYTVGFIALWFGVHVSWLLMDGFTDELHRADLAVVFGNKVHRNGQPSKRLRMRLDRTLQLYKKGYFPTILVSGGKGAEGHDEAVVMKRYLVAQGIPAQAILVDSLGLTTRHTALHAARRLHSRNWRSVLLISQYYHISRAKLAARRAGITTIYSAQADYHFEWREIYSTAREVLGFYAYLLVTFRTSRDINMQHNLNESN